MIFDFDSWLKCRQRRELDLDSGELVSLNLRERPKPSSEDKAACTVAQHGARKQSITNPPAGPWNRRYALFSIALIPLVISLLAPDGTRDTLFAFRIQSNAYRRATKAESCRVFQSTTSRYRT